MKIFSKHTVVLMFGFAINLQVFVAQQIPVYSQFFMNKYTQNPAFAGMDHLYSVTSNHRYQWVGLKDFPRTYTLSINGPTKDLKNGIGAFLYADNVGPTRRTGVQASYAYHTKINEQIKHMDLVLTGEGHFDEQSTYGKLALQVAKLTQQHKIKTLVFAGKTSLSSLPNLPHLEIHQTTPHKMPLDQAMKNAAQNLRSKLLEILGTYKNQIQ